MLTRGSDAGIVTEWQLRFNKRDIMTICDDIKLLNTMRMSIDNR